jgi:eukaryotic-like serine/threonine-protein kinase
MAGPEPKLRDIFSKALLCQTGEEQAAYLEQICQGNGELRARLDELLQAHREAGSFLQEPPTAGAATVDPLPIAERPGTVIGPYKLLQQIGEGGMGTVYMAEQTYPVQRKVALKVIKAGMDSRQIIARFEAERQALALMDHVNIARVFDAGAAASGRPYFVMELVHGVPITNYCDDNHLTPRQRLELFVPVCQAIQHAHQKGIIHRDIKPSNVMITLYDGRPVAKVIDFGVAKATEQKLTERTLFTQYGTMVGTLEYMSPEQAEMSALGVDTRSDIFSLGVLLYELLTGSTPLSHKRLKEAAYGEILRMIREEEAPRPSIRLSDSGEALASISAQRHMEPARLTKLVKGELDWIVMKTLEKDRNRRYETANGFAADIQRYLSDEPVKACPPSAGYLFRKFARRNKRAMAMVAVVAAAVLALIAGALVHNSRLGVALQDAQANLEKAGLAEEQAQVAEQEKTRQLAIAHLREAQAGRRGGLMGRRFGSLEALKKATEQFRALGQLDDKRTLELRNEAIACLALADLKPGKERTPDPGWSRPYGFDPMLRYYVVRSTADDYPEKPELHQGHLSIRRVADDREVAFLPGFGTRVTKVQFSPNGCYLAAHYGDLDRPLHNYVWDVSRREPILKESHANYDTFPSFSSDGRLVAVSRPDDSIRIYELPSGTRLKDLPPSLPVARVHFHPNGRRLAVVSDSIVQLRNLTDGKELATFKHPAEVAALAWRSDGKVFATGCHDHDIYLWDVAHAAQPLRILKGHFGPVVNLRFNHGGDLLLSNGWDSTDRLWDPMTGQQLLSKPGGVYREQHFGPDDQGLDDGWQVATGRECRTFHGPKPPGQVDISPKGRLMASVCAEGVQLWDLAATREGDKLLATLSVGDSMAVHFDPKGDSLITSSKGMGLQRWPITADPEADGLRIGPPLSLGLSARAPFCGDDPDFALSDNGRTVALSPNSGEVLLFDLEDPRRKLHIESAHLRHAAFSRDGRWLATGNWQRRGAKVWDTRTGMLTHDLDLGEPEVRAAWPAFSPDGKWLVTGTVVEYRFWEVGSWHKKHGLPRQNAGQSPGWIVFAPDGKMLAVLHSMTEVRLVDPATGREFARLPTTGGPYCFSPDGSQLVTYAGRDGAMHVWDLRLIRRQLREMDLDWDLPTYPQPSPEPARPLRVQVLTAEPLPPSKELDAEAHFERALLHLLLRQYAGATDDFERAHVINPKLVRWEELFRAYEQVIENYPAETEAYWSRGHAHEWLGQWAQAIDDYSRAIELKSHSKAIWGNRAGCYAELSQWKEATADFARAVELNKDDGQLWYRQALVRLQMGDAAGYRKVCADMLGQFGPAAKNDYAVWTVWTCVLAPDAVVDWNAALQFAEKAVAGNPKDNWALHRYGATLYRAGQYQEALEQLTEAEAAYQPTDETLYAIAYNWLFLAMAHQRLGHIEEAKKWHDKAVQWIDRAMQKKPEDPAVANHLPWNRRVTLSLLRPEAEELLRKKDL